MTKVRLLYSTIDQHKNLLLRKVYSNVSLETPHEDIFTMMLLDYNYQNLTILESLWPYQPSLPDQHPR